VFKAEGRKRKKAKIGAWGWGASSRQRGDAMDVQMKKELTQLKYSSPGTNGFTKKTHRCVQGKEGGDGKNRTWRGGRGRSTGIRGGKKVF